MDIDKFGDPFFSKQASSSSLKHDTQQAGLRVGRGAATGHHGEIFQGVHEAPDGCLHRGLVSLPCSMFISKATFYPDSSGIINVEPAWKVKASKAVKLALAFANKPTCGGLLRMRSNIPVGWGLGSSTSDVTAAIRATADALGQTIELKDIALLAVKAETASDSTMFNGCTVLFAQREGYVLEDFKGPLPRLEVVGFNVDPTNKGIETLSFSPAHYTWWEIETFKPMIGLLRRAIYTQDPKLVGQVATASAYINQTHLPKPCFEDLTRAVEIVKAVGLQVAHSGTVVGLLFDPSDADKERKINHAQDLIAEMGFGQTWRFRTG